MNYGISKIIGLDRPSTTAFTIHTSQKTLAVSYLVWRVISPITTRWLLFPGLSIT